MSDNDFINVGDTHETMYSYRALDTVVKEIRILQLLPGAFEESIRIKFHHVALAPRGTYSQNSKSRATRSAIQQTLPADWVVRQCLDGRYLFERVKNYGLEEPYETRWTHPLTGVNPNGDQNEYVVEEEYEGLSYVWAPPIPEEWAQVLEPFPVGPTNLRSASQGVIAIRPNLAAALRQLRLPDKERRMWVDALCINQADIAERSSQVQLMHDIYRRAYRVIVWLGSERENSKIAVDVLRYLGEQAIHTEGGAWLTSPPGCQDPALVRSSVPLPYDERTWKAILNLLKRPWFERLWVWQEIRLADERSMMLCGADSISLSLFRRAIFCASDKRELPSAEARGLILDALEMMLPFSRQPFFRDLQMLNWKGCSNPRDKIYGVLGAAPRLIRDHLRPDYSLSVEEVYRIFCDTYLKNIHRLDFLDRCNLDARQIAGPSWVPDWSVSVDRAVRLPYADVFYAAGASPATFGSSAEPGAEILQVMGVECGKVSFVGNKAPLEFDDLIATIKSWEAAALATPSYRPTGEPALDAFMNLLGLGYSRERWPQCHSLLTIPEAARVYTKAFAGDDEDTAAATESLNFIRVRHRYFFFTDTGYAGVGHARPKAGDRLAVLLGCPSPLLLRPANREKLQGWQVVGPVYSHGLMDTEALLGPIPHGWAVRMGREHGFFDSMRFFNYAAGAETQDDPRLGQDPPNWERLEATRTADDPWNFARYRHRTTGEIVNSDPRLWLDALTARDVKLEAFDLL
ncbi:hypothetical protein PG988_003663 [Apiospora saccharicola]